MPNISGPGDEDDRTVGRLLPAGDPGQAMTEVGLLSVTE